MKQKVDVLLGLQWGDEGKGKIVDFLTPHYDIIARFQGGPNAGHTLVFNGFKQVLHTLPSGIFHAEKTNLIGNGVIIDPYILLKEIISVKEKGANPIQNLNISHSAHLILPTHRLLDAVNEQCKGDHKIGSTLKGIGPCYTDKTARNGIAIGKIHTSSFHDDYERLKNYHLKLIAALGANASDFKIEGYSLSEYESLWMQALAELKAYKIVDCALFVNQALETGKKILAEGAQGTLLDLDFGSYPYVTSSNTIAAGVCTGLGLAPSKIGRVFGVFKAYCTRVGNGPFPTELMDETGQKMREKGNEFGSTTGRPRRCGWLDVVALRYSIMLNGVTSLFMMKADVLDDFETIQICNSYRTGSELFLTAAPGSGSPEYISFAGWKTDLQIQNLSKLLPENLKNYIDYIENQTGIPVSMVSTGPDRTQTHILKDDLFNI